MLHFGNCSRIPILQFQQIVVMPYPILIPHLKMYIQEEHPNTHLGMVEEKVYRWQEIYLIPYLPLYICRHKRAKTHPDVQRPIFPHV